MMKIGQRIGSRVKSHIVLDTGMGRLGFTDKDFISEFPQISSLSNIEIEGVATHFPCSDRDLKFTNNQIEKFETIIKESKLKARWIHLANSAGVINFGNAVWQYDTPRADALRNFPNTRFNSQIQACHGMEDSNHSDKEITFRVWGSVMGKPSLLIKLLWSQRLR